MNLFKLLFILFSLLTCVGLVLVIKGIYRKNKNTLILGMVFLVNGLFGCLFFGYQQYIK